MSSNTADLMVGNRLLSTLRVVDLKQELEKRGLSKSGSKKDLVDRLRLHLQIEKHRDTGASADEEELPNYSQVHDELADQNPFIRDYLASQAELFHSQKVVKKLVEEEAKRESETSADEGVDSPMKQPPALEREESPVTETRRQSRRRIDSQREDMTAEKVVTTRSSRSRSNERRDDSQSGGDNAQNKSESEENGEESKIEVKNKLEAKTETTTVVVEEKINAVMASSLSTPVREKSPEKEAPAIHVEEPDPPNDEPQTKTETKSVKEDENLEKANSVSETTADEVVDSHIKQPPVLESERRDDGQSKIDISQSISESKETGKESIIEAKDKSSEAKSDTKTVVVEENINSSLSSTVRAESPEKETLEIHVEDANISKDEPQSKTETKSVKEDEKVEKAQSESEVAVNVSLDSPIKQPPALEREESPVAETRRQSRRRTDSQREDTAAEKEVSTRSSRSRSSERRDDTAQNKSESEETLEESKIEEEKKLEAKSDTTNVVVEEKMRTGDASPPRSNESGEDDSKGEDEKRSEPEENDDDSRSRGEESPAVEEASKTSRSRSSSASRSPAREKSPEKDTLELRVEEPDLPKDETPPQTTSETKPVEEEEKMDVDESTSPRYKSSQKETSYTNNDIAGEEALDYGEEEDDEDRNESDPQEFSWGRRSLRFKNKSNFAAPASKWKLEEDSKHHVVKSNLLNSYYDDIKLVPLEQLKLEEKSSESATENKKKEIERKPSISKVEPIEPLLTRTVENVAPTIKRTVSIIPSTKTLADNAEETDKALTPPRNPPSDVLLITNLVRPFTLIQLKEMLQRTGNLQDIWVDKIKSKCIAKFGSQEEAFETRAALHGVCWPNSNPKSLHVDYTTQDNLDEHKAKDGAEQSATSEKPVSAQPVPVREWDVGKKAEPKSPGRIRKRSRSRSTSRDRSKRARRSSSPGRRRRSKSPAHERRSRGGEGKEPEPMGKALDELFRKTAATPSIYWLPLTPEQIAEKEELRRKRMLERERRLAELSKMRPR